MKTMRRRLPSLNALKTFEAVARHLHMGHAAIELRVTDGAVSHQIRALESELKVQLFQRGGSNLALTDEGERLAPLVQRAFDLLDYAIQGVEIHLADVALTIACEPAMAAKWLAPRLGDFLAANPNLHVNLRPLWDSSALSRGEVDAFICYGSVDQPGFRSELLARLHFFPVVSPRLCRGPKAIRKPQDLIHHTLLYEHDPSDWQQWLNANGVDVTDMHGMQLTNAHMTIDAAIAGYGVALGDPVLAAADLQAGRLVRPFGTSILAPKPYQLVTADNPNTQKVAAFREWLIGEIRRYPNQ
jgi:LysR family glycine cleavage system transcriptional activator